MCVRLTTLFVRPPLCVHSILKRRNVYVCMCVCVKKKIKRACSVRRRVSGAKTLVSINLNFFQEYLQFSDS